MKALLKRIIPKNTWLYTLGEKVSRYVRGYPNPWEFDVLDAYAKKTDKVKFIQIGSNNGVNGDPIHDYIIANKWQGILVEPVPFIFKKLKLNYEHSKDNLWFENSAIAHTAGRLKFYRLRENDLPGIPQWYDQLGSFNREVIFQHRESIPQFDELLIEDTVEAITFSDLLKKYKVNRLNLIHIDTEGYDYEILTMIPFQKLHVDIIMFENKHLSSTHYRMAINLLNKHGYKLGTKDYGDTIAIKKNIIQLLRKRDLR